MNQFWQKMCLYPVMYSSLVVSKYCWNHAALCPSGSSPPEPWWAAGRCTKWRATRGEKVPPNTATSMCIQCRSDELQRRYGYTPWRVHALHPTRTAHARIHAHAPLPKAWLSSTCRVTATTLTHHTHIHLCTILQHRLQHRLGAKKSSVECQDGRKVCDCSRDMEGPHKPLGHAGRCGVRTCAAPSRFTQVAAEDLACLNAHGFRDVSTCNTSGPEPRLLGTQQGRPVEPQDTIHTHTGSRDVR